MADPTGSFFPRLGLAFQAFFRILFQAEFANSVAQRLQGEESKPQTPVLRESDSDAACQLLGLLQQKGRLVDFLEEEVAQYEDAEIGAAVRVVHEGCRKALHEHFSMSPIREESEGARVTLEPGFDASANRPTGNLIGEPPFTGTLAHRGWRVTEVRLPKFAQGHDVRIIAPAEVEL
jgi:hypothetical protein